MSLFSDFLLVSGFVSGFVKLNKSSFPEVVSNTSGFFYACSFCFFNSRISSQNFRIPSDIFCLCSVELLFCFIFSKVSGECLLPFFISNPLFLSILYISFVISHYINTIAVTKSSEKMDRETAFLIKQRQYVEDTKDLQNELQFIEFFKNVEIEDAYKTFLNLMCRYKHLPAWFIRQNKNVLDWSLIKKYQVLCDDFREEFKDYL